jgi:hypothetical protein
MSADYGLPAIAPTKDQHDARVAITGRPFTDLHMRDAKTESEAGDGDPTSVLDRVIAQSRREAS